MINNTWVRQTITKQQKQQKQQKLFLKNNLKNYIYYIVQVKIN